MNLVPKIEAVLYTYGALQNLIKLEGGPSKEYEMDNPIDIESDVEVKEHK